MCGSTGHNTVDPALGPSTHNPCGYPHGQAFYFCSYILATIILWVGFSLLLQLHPCHYYFVAGFSSWAAVELACLFFRQAKDSPAQPSAYSMIPNNTSPSKFHILQNVCCMTRLCGNHIRAGADCHVVSSLAARIANIVPWPKCHCTCCPALLP